MARRNVTLEIRARNALQKGLASAGKQLRAFGASAVRIGKQIAKSFLVMGAAAVGFATVALRAFAKQEKAENELASAFELHGESVDALLPKYKRLARAIQDQTGVADDLTLSRMAALRMMGVEEKQLGDATKAMIALTRAGMGEGTAQRALAMATKGNFDMLNRYIPALRMAETETQKIAAVNEFVSNQYAAQKRDLDTVAGAWAAFRGRVGDLWEEFGNVIVQLIDIPGLLHRAGSAVKGFGQTIRDWVESDRFQALKASIEGVLAALRQGGEARAEMARAMMDVVVAGFGVAAERAVNILIAAAPKIGKIIGAMARMAWDSVSDPSRDAMGKAFAEAGTSANEIAKAMALGTKEEAKQATELNKKIRARARELDQAETLRDLGISTADAIEGQTAAETRLNAALSRTVALAAKYRKDREDAADAVEDEIEAVDVAAPRVGPTPEEIAQERRDLQQLEREYKDARRRVANEAIRSIKDEIRAREELAKKTVESFMEQRKARQDEDKAVQDDIDKAAKLRAKEERGIKLSRRDREFLEAFDELQKQRDMGDEKTGLNAQLAEAKNQLTELQGQNRTLDKIYTDLHWQKVHLATLLRAQ